MWKKFKQKSFYKFQLHIFLRNFCPHTQTFRCAHRAWLSYSRTSRNSCVWEKISTGVFSVIFCSFDFILIRFIQAKISFFDSLLINYTPCMFIFPRTNKKWIFKNITHIKTWTCHYSYIFTLPFIYIYIFFSLFFFHLSFDY